MNSIVFCSLISFSFKTYKKTRFLLFELYLPININAYAAMRRTNVQYVCTAAANVSQHVFLFGSLAHDIILYNFERNWREKV